MTHRTTSDNGTSRRDFLKTSSTAAVASADRFRCKNSASGPARPAIRSAWVLGASTSLTTHSPRSRKNYFKLGAAQSKRSTALGASPQFCTNTPRSPTISVVFSPAAAVKEQDTSASSPSG